MISNSDLVIVVVASSALAVGVYRWHENTQDVSSITVPASSQISSEVAPEPTYNNGTVNSNTAGTTRIIDGSGLLSNDSVNSGAEQTLTAPVVTEVITTESVTVTDSNDNSTQLGVHVVRSGDFLGRIASQYGTDVATLRQLNGISGSIIQVGQEILYPQ